MADVKDFLSPNAMLTPGIAGGLTVSIALPLAFHFDVSFKWSALAISFLLGIIVVSSFTDPLSKPLRIVYCLLNSLIIFSVSAGVGSNIDAPPPPPPELLSSTQSAAGYKRSSHLFGDIVPGWIGVTPAFADPPAHTLGDAALTEPQASRETGHEEERQETSSSHRRDGEATQPPEESERENRLKAAERLRQYQEQLQRYRKRWSW
jgi:hypothetical protein